MPVAAITWKNTSPERTQAIMEEPSVNQAFDAAYDTLNTQAVNIQNDETPTVEQSENNNIIVNILNPEKDNSWLDLLGSGNILKRLITAGTGERPLPGQEVHVRFSARVLQAAPVGPFEVREYDRSDDLVFRVGDGDIAKPGLELPVQLMYEGEHSIIRCLPRYAYDDSGCAELGVPPNACIEFDVEITSLGRPRSAPESMTVLDRAEAVAEKKVLGNTWFQKGDYKMAVRTYRKGLSFLKGWDKEEARIEAEAEEEDEVSSLQNVPVAEAPTDSIAVTADALRSRRAKRTEDLSLLCRTVVDCANNLAAACSKLPGDEFEKGVKDACMQVLEMEPNNVKALFRIGRFCVDRNDFVEAEAALSKAARLSPNDKLIREQLARLAERRAAHRSREREMFRFRDVPAHRPAPDAQARAPAPAPPCVDPTSEAVLAPPQSASATYSSSTSASSATAAAAAASARILDAAVEPSCSSAILDADSGVTEGERGKRQKGGGGGGSGAPASPGASSQRGKREKKSSVDAAAPRAEEATSGGSVRATNGSEGGSEVAAGKGGYLSSLLMREPLPARWRILSHAVAAVVALGGMRLFRLAVTPPSGPAPLLKPAELPTVAPQAWVADAGVPLFSSPDVELPVVVLDDEEF